MTNGRRAVALLAVIVFGMALLAGSATAVHDLGVFQLDGNAQTSVQSNPPATDDWDRVCHQVTITNDVGGTIPDECASAGDSAANAVSWTSEPDRNASIFTSGGSKDPQDISNWRWKDGAGGLPDKDNLLHSFAARYAVPTTDPTPGTDPSDDGECPTNQAPCSILYFGSDRLDNSGDAQQGFWFLQNKVGLSNTVANGAFTFNGLHTPGDLLILSDFSNGGGTATINLYKWVTSGGDVATHLLSLGGSASAECTPALTVDFFCGIVNPTDGTPAPWSFTDKSGNSSFLNGEFYEGGVNLSNLGLAGECFASFLSETRSSTSPTATLKDFVLGSFAPCESHTTTTPKQADGTTNIPAGGLSIGGGSVGVKDTAVVTGGGTTTDPTGTVNFFLCGPLTSGNCNTGGTSIGSGTLSSTGTPTSESSTTSPLVTITSVGHYCFRGEYQGDGLFPPSQDPAATDATSQTECFDVNPVTPTLATTAGAGPVPLGTAVTDTATLSGTATRPTGPPPFNTTGTTGAAAGGTITFTLFKADCTTKATGSGTNPQTVTVNGDGTYGPVSFTPDAPGTYHWVASYTGDSPNTLATSHNATCNDTGEDVVVIGSQLKTDQFIYPNDTATVREDPAATTGDITGSVTFRLFDTLANCTANGATGLLYSQTVSLPVAAASEKSVSTSNTGTAVSSSTTVYWNVSYGGDSLHPGRKSACAENTAVAFTNAPYPGSAP